jgi:hypothetical protein
VPVHGLGPNALTIEDEPDGFDPVALLIAGNVYLQQGESQIFLGLAQSARLAAALATTPSPDASPDSGEIEADRDHLHDLITKVGVYSEQEDECLPLKIVDESDPSTGHVGEVRLYLPAGYQIVRTAR